MFQNKQFKILLIAILTLLLCSCAGTRPPIMLPAKPPPAPPLKHPVHVALILGSGGARGYAHLGVLQVFQWARIPIDLIVGASAGSYVAALFADSNDAIKTYHIMMDADFWNFADIGNFPSLSGIIKGYRLEKYLLKHMQARTFRQLKINYVAVTTDLRTGEPFFIKSGPVAPAVLASAAVPGIVRPVHIYGRTLIDGGIADPIPVNAAEPYHPDIIIAINIAEQIPKKLPDNAIDIYFRANDIIWQRLTQYSLEGASLIIHPPVGQIGTFDLEDRYQMYLAGYNAALKALPKLKRLLRKHHIALIPKSYRKKK